MKIVKRIGALALALCLVLALGVTALAAGTGILAGSADSTTALTSFTFDVALNKLASVNSPENTVTYVLAPAADADVANPYKVGPADGIKFDPAGNNTATFPVNPTDAQCTQTITVAVDASKFTAPGVYRYKITETVNKTALGFAAADGTEKYIDVFVKNAGSGNIVYAVAMGAALDANKGLTEKDSDFNISYTTDPGSDPDDPGDDTPKSYDVTVSKVLGSGGAEDPAETFDFALTLKALADAAGVNVTVEKTGTAAGADSLTLAATDVESTYTMKGGESFTVKGLPKTLAIEVVETVSGLDGYTTTMSVSSMDSADTATARTAKGTVSGEGGTITFTNTRETISPTGVILRVAPLVILLGASFVFYAMSRKSKKNKA